MRDTFHAEVARHVLSGLAPGEEERLLHLLICEACRSWAVDALEKETAEARDSYEAVLDRAGALLPETVARVLADQEESAAVRQDAWALYPLLDAEEEALAGWLEGRVAVLLGEEPAGPLLDSARRRPAAGVPPERSPPAARAVRVSVASGASALQMSPDGP